MTVNKHRTSAEKPMCKPLFAFFHNQCIPQPPDYVAASAVYITLAHKSTAMRPSVFRIDPNGANPNNGRVVWSPAKSIWNNAMLLLSVLVAPFYISISAVFLFLTLTYGTLLFGHSVGMHRAFIHRSLRCEKWLERLLIYLGVLVGMAGPFGILKIHDIRDWAQREPSCHDFFSHRSSFLVDAFWQLNCRFEFEKPPRFEIEPSTISDPWYRFLEQTWMLQQLPLAILLYYFGGLPWVLWGVCVRVFVSNFAHWTVTYVTHNPGPGNWFVKEAGVQASNLNGFGFISMGECWHNNHNAFPESAQIGLYKGETDPGWLVIQFLDKLGFVKHIGVPRGNAEREDLLHSAN